jgi:hypothetical protein
MRPLVVVLWFQCVHLWLYFGFNASTCGCYLVSTRPLVEHYNRGGTCRHANEKWWRFPLLLFICNVRGPRFQATRGVCGSSRFRVDDFLVVRLDWTRTVPTPRVMEDLPTFVGSAYGSTVDPRRFDSGPPDLNRTRDLRIPIHIANQLDFRADTQSIDSGCYGSSIDLWQQPTLPKCVYQCPSDNTNSRK